MSAFRSLPEIIDYRANSQAGELAYRYYTHDKCIDLTYSELKTAVLHIASFLKAQGINRDPVLIALAPGIEYVIAVYGCLYAGAIPIPAYPPKRNHNNKRLLNIIENVSAKHIISSKFKTNLWPDNLNVHSFESMQNHPITTINPFLAKSDEIAFIQYTSGTTSLPKGVMVSHGNIFANLTIIDHYLKNCERKISSWLPPYHDMGLIAGIFLPLYIGAPAILMAPTYFLQAPLRWLELIAKEQITTAFMPNFAFDYCVNKVSREQISTLDLSCLKHAFNGAEPIHYQTAQRFYDHLNVAKLRPETLLTGYGLAENTLMATGAKDSQWQRPLYVEKNALLQGRIELTDENHPHATTFVSSGSTFPLHEIAIVNPDSKVELPDLTIGEIWLTGPSVALGYWNHPEKNKEIFNATLANNAAKTYLRTSDLGFKYKEELYVTGRMNDLIIIRGANHYAHDIEYTVMHAHPALRINGSAVFTVLKNQQEELFIAQELQREQLSQSDKNTVIASIRRALLAEHGLQADVILLLPPNGILKTSSGKIQRNACKEAYLAETFAIQFTWKLANHVIHDHAKTADEGTKWVMNWIANRNGISANTLQLNIELAELGFDSIVAAEFAADAAKQFNKTFDIGDIIENKTIQELLQLVDSQTAAPLRKIKMTAALIPISAHPFEDALKGMYLAETQGISGAVIKIADRELINFSSYNYLGMSGSNYVTEAAIQAIQTYGTSVSASRIASGQKPIHRELEQALARLIGTEDCLVYSAGHATNISVITQLFGAGDLIIYDVLSHNSLMQGIQFSGAKAIAFPHNDCAALEKILSAQAGQFNKVLIVTEGIFSMDGDIPNIPAMLALKKKFNAFLMIDEAHSIGTIGKSGAGIREYFQLAANEVDIWMGTLSKAFASCGGYIAGSKTLIEHLKFYANSFVYSAGISPANTAAALASIQLMALEPERIAQLHTNQTLFLSLLKAHGIPTGDSTNSPIIPVMLGDDELTLTFAKKLQADGIYALPIVFPAVAKQSARVRFFISALHTKAHLQQTVDVIVNHFPSRVAAVND